MEYFLPVTVTSFDFMGKAITAVNKEIHCLTKQKKTIKTILLERAQKNITTSS